jgi:hypothetical protein
MAETDNIARMAELLATEIFPLFYWDKIGPMNENWTCYNPLHEKKTHPSDIVFTYKEPYNSFRSYLNCDLKSYAKNSITPGSIRTAINNLALSVQCAQISAEWQKKYMHHSDNYNIFGLLFIYNHDGEYDSNFDNLLTLALTEDVTIPQNVRIFVLGPSDICYLNTVITDLKVLRGDKKIADKEHCSFYYPDLVNKRANSLISNLPGTIEVLTSPYQVIKYTVENISEMLIYYRRTGSSEDEFLFLFDYLFHYQQLQTNRKIVISLPYPDKNAPANFEHAKVRYCMDRDNADSIQEILHKVEYRTVTNVNRQFSTTEIGMRYE